VAQLYLKKWWWPVAIYWMRQQLVSGDTTIEAPKALIRAPSIDRGAPKTPSGVRYGEGCPLRSRLGVWRAPWALPEGQEQSPGCYSIFLACFRPQKLRIAWKIANSTLKMAVMTVTTTFKSGGNNSTLSHINLRLWHAMGRRQKYEMCMHRWSHGPHAEYTLTRAQTEDHCFAHRRDV